MNVNASIGGNVDNDFTAGSANLVKDTATTVATLSGVEDVRKVIASGSGLMKVEILFGVTSSEAVIATFFNSTANPNIEFTLEDSLPVPSGSTIFVRCTNLENAASPSSDFDGYATIVTVA